jgi:hypothetical protein
MSLPYALMPVPRQQFCDPDGFPYAAGTLYFYVAGTSTPKAVYSTAEGSVSLGTSITLDAGGYAVGIFLAPGGYKVALYDADAVLVWTQDGVEDIASTFFDELGVNLVTGADSESSGYIVTADDWFVSMSSTGGADPCVVALPQCADHPAPLIIKNLGTVALSLVPDGGDTIEGVNAAYAVPVGTPSTSPPVLPTVWLANNGASAWYILASHGV